MSNYVPLISGIALLGAILGLFWLKDHLRSPRLARLAYSGLVARLAFAGAALCVFGVLLILSDWFSR